MTTSEKVAYLKGLADGLGIDGESKEGKLLSCIMDILEDLALDIEDIDASIDELNDGLDAVSDDLELVEDLIYGEEDTELEELVDESEDEDEDEEGVFYEVVCPACGEHITFDESVLDNGGMDCPACGELLEFDFDAEEEEEE